MDYEASLSFLIAVEASFADLPTLDRMAFGMEATADAISTEHGVILAQVFPIPFLAMYRGGVTRIVGELVEILGRCDCRTCHRDKEAPRYVSRVIGTDLVVSHSRGSSYLLAGE